MLYAAYGSNLHPERLKERVPSARLCGSSLIEGWGLRFHKRGRDGSSKCDMVPTAETLYLAVYEIDPGEKPYLDKIESLGEGYREKEIHLPHYGNCFLYIAQGSHIEPGLKPFWWYKELVLLGCLHHGFPSNYVETIQQVPHVEDHDNTRHERCMSLVRKIRQGTK